MSNGSSTKQPGSFRHTCGTMLYPPVAEDVAAIEGVTRVVKHIVILLCPGCEETVCSNFFPHGPEVVKSLELKK